MVRRRTRRIALLTPFHFDQNYLLMLFCCLRGYNYKYIKSMFCTNFTRVGDWKVIIFYESAKNSSRRLYIGSVGLPERNIFFIPYTLRYQVCCNLMMFSFTSFTINYQVNLMMFDFYLVGEHSSY